MNILDIYQKYQIMPQLVEHQLRVAAVGSLIADNFVGDVNRQDIISACLLHDMGNIIKFDLSETQKLNSEFKDEDLKFWQKIKDEYIQKYRTDEHTASIMIARELGVSARMAELVDCIDFNSGKVNAESKDFGQKICAYSDMRVMPKGVASLEDRLADLRVRYDKKFRQMGGNEANRLDFENALRQIERQIFEHCNIKPEDITEQTTSDIKELLKNFDI